MNDEDMDWLQEVKVFVIDGALVVTVFCMLVVLALLDALERKDRVIRSIKQEAETALVIGDEIGMRDGLVQILKEADQEFGITTRN